MEKHNECVRLPKIGNTNPRRSGYFDHEIELRKQHKVDIKNCRIIKFSLFDQPINKSDPNK